MTGYTQVAKFTYPSDLVVIKGILESNDIECYVRDELTIQVHNFYSNALGGIRLEVPENKQEIAKNIIIESGFKKNLILDTTTDYLSTDKKSKNNHLKIIKYGIRFLFIASIILILIVVGLTLYL